MGQQSHSTTSTTLNRIAWLSKQDSQKEFECLMHLFNEESLKIARENFEDLFSRSTAVSRLK